MTGRAHNLSEKPRTEDVLIHDDFSFKDLLLSDFTLKGLEGAGFIKPSPIQRKAIPMGKCGFDLIVQAKSGTGKTCVFTVVALEMIKPELEKLQVLIISPTREISVQIRDVISMIGKSIKNLRAEAFIGGMPLENDKKKLQKCQIAVGAPGRVKHLISEGLMKVDTVRLFVLDEADKLMEDNFRKDINFIYLKLPEVKQMIATSATFPRELEDFVVRYMANPMRISPGQEVFLLGIRHFVSVVPSHLSVFVQMKNKMAEVFRILSTVSFKQCLIFSNYQSRAESICNELNKKGWPAVYISGSQNQTIRLKAISSFKEFKCRVLLSTDLTSRGIDAENVNLIINLDLPYDGPTYMHRSGRAGRYGTYGFVITIVQTGSELEQFRKMLNEIGGANYRVSVFPKEKFDFDIWKTEDKDFEKISIIEEKYNYSRIKGGREGENKSAKNRKNGNEEKETMKVKPLEDIFSPYLIEKESTNNSKLMVFKGLVKTELKSNKQEASKIKIEDKDFCFKDLSSEVMSYVACLEHQDWENYMALLKENNIKNKFKTNCPSSVKTIEENMKVEERNLDDDVDDDYSNDDDVDDDCDFGNNFNYKSEEELNCESCMNSESESSTESLTEYYRFVKQWYNMWYDQILTITCYVKYLKQFYYFKKDFTNR